MSRKNLIIALIVFFIILLALYAFYFVFAGRINRDPEPSVSVSLPLVKHMHL